MVMHVYVQISDAYISLFVLRINHILRHQICKIFRYKAMQCLITDTVSACWSVSKLQLSLHFPFTASLRLSLPNIFISSLLPSDISIALLLPRRLRGELEHMCVSRSVFVRSAVRAYVLWVLSLHVTLTGTKQVQAKWI